MDRKYFVSYETAKLLKEKGFPQEHEWFYCDDGKGITPSWDGCHCFRSDAVARPTYHEVINWLEGKGICIDVRMGWCQKTKRWLWCGYNVYVVKDEDYETSQLIDWCLIREDALNAGILKALELL